VSSFTVNYFLHLPTNMVISQVIMLVKLHLCMWESGQFDTQLSRDISSYQNRYDI